MPEVPIDISRGEFPAIDAGAIPNTGFAAGAKNIVINDVGSNITRPGLTQFTEIGAAPVIGLTYMKYAGSTLVDKVVGVTEDRRIYSINESGDIVDITGSATLEGTARPEFAQDGAYVAIAGGGEPKEWSGTGNTASLTGSPPDTNVIRYLDQYWILLLKDDQELRFAGPTAAARQSFSATNFFQSEGLPDQAVHIETLQRELWAFSEDSIEVYQNFGDAVVPFRRTFFLESGIIARQSVVKTDNTLFWLDEDRRFVRAQGRTPTLISSPYDSTIKRLATVSDCWGEAVNIDGNYLVSWTFPSIPLTVVYDYKHDNWTEWEGVENGDTARFRGNAFLYVKEWDKHLVGDYNSGTIWEMSPTAYADGSNPLRFLRRTGEINHGTGKKKKSNHYIMNVKTGIGASGATEPLMSVRAKDDGKDWTDPVLVGLGLAGNTSSDIRVRVPGVYNKRQLEISVTDAVDFQLHSVIEDVEVGTI